MRIEAFCIRELSKVKNVATPFKFVSFEIFEGEILGLIGLHSSGMETLVDVITGFQRADTGRIYSDSRPIDITAPTVAHACGIYRIRLTPVTFEKMTVADNIGIYRDKMKGFWNRSMKSVLMFAEDFCERYGISIDLGRGLEGMSDYEKTLIELLRAVMNRARLIVLDGVLDACSEKEFADLQGIMGKIRRDGVSFLVIGTRVGGMMQVSDRILAMSGGHISGAFVRSEFDEAALYRVLTSTGRRKHARPATRIAEEAVLSAEGGVLSGMGQDAGFFVGRGEAVSFVDIKGVPVRTVADMLCGRVPAIGGRLLMNGSPIAPNSLSSALREGVGLVTGTAEEQTFGNLTVEENLMMMKYREYSDAFGTLDRRMLDFAAVEYARMLGIGAEFLTKRAGECSYEERALIPLLKWIIVRPQVLVLDNPLANTDCFVFDRIVECIDVIKGRGTGVVFYSPIRTELNMICDRIYEFPTCRVVGSF